MPGHEWQPGSHSGPSGLVFPELASCSSPCDQGKGQEEEHKLTVFIWENAERWMVL